MADTKKFDIWGRTLALCWVALFAGHWVGLTFLQWAGLITADQIVVISDLALKQIYLILLALTLLWNGLRWARERNAPPQTLSTTPQETRSERED